MGGRCRVPGQIKRVTVAAERSDWAGYEAAVGRDLVHKRQALSLQAALDTAHTCVLDVLAGP